MKSGLSPRLRRLQAVLSFPGPSSGPQPWPQPQPSVLVAQRGLETREVPPVLDALSLLTEEPKPLTDLKSTSQPPTPKRRNVNVPPHSAQLHPPACPSTHDPITGLGQEYDPEHMQERTWVERKEGGNRGEAGKEISLWASASSSVQGALCTSDTLGVFPAQPAVGSDSGWTTLKLHHLAAVRSDPVSKSQPVPSLPHGCQPYLAFLRHGQSTPY